MRLFYVVLGTGLLAYGLRAFRRELGDTGFFDGMRAWASHPVLAGLAILSLALVILSAAMTQTTLRWTNVGWTLFGLAAAASLLVNSKALARFANRATASPRPRGARAATGAN